MDADLTVRLGRAAGAGRWQQAAGLQKTLLRGWLRGGGPAGLASGPTSDTAAATPLELHDGIWVKRDDLFRVGGSHGGKVRACLGVVADWEQEAGRRAPGLVTAGSRHSPQVNIVATVAASMGIPCRAHVAEANGGLRGEVAAAARAGAVIVGHRPGHNTVIKARARDDAAARGWVHVPYGMECAAAVQQTARQVLATAAALPPGVRRFVVPVGSGMSLAGVLVGMDAAGLRLPVLGVAVGPRPEKRLDCWAPGWRRRATLADSGLPYFAEAPVQHVGAVQLDPVYEAKCVPFLREGDLFWVVGHRETMRPAALPAPRAPGPRTLTISAATLTRQLDCTPDGITGGCHGACCYQGPGGLRWPGNADPQPDGACHYLGPAGCTLDPLDKPVKCLLYPLMEKPGRPTLPLYFRAPNGTCKACDRKGPPLALALYPSLAALIGAAEAARVAAAAQAGEDVTLTLPAEVAAALDAEHAEEAARTLPPPRTTRPRTGG